MSTKNRKIHLRIACLRDNRWIIFVCQEDAKSHGGVNHVLEVRGMERKMKAILKRFHGEESGASLVEYGLLVGLIAVAAIAAVTALGGSIGTLFNNVEGSLPA